MPSYQLAGGSNVNLFGVAESVAEEVSLIFQHTLVMCHSLFLSPYMRPFFSPQTRVSDHVKPGFSVLTDPWVTWVFGFEETWVEDYPVYGPLHVKIPVNLARSGVRQLICR